MRGGAVSCAGKGRRVRAGRSGALIVLCLFFAAFRPAIALAARLSLFPSRDPAALLAEIDDLGPQRSRLALGQWRPYGLPGVAIQMLDLSLPLGPLRWLAGYEQQDWGVLRARRIRLACLTRGAGALRLGLEGGQESLEGGAPLRSVHLLLAGGKTVSLGLRYLLWDSDRHGEIAIVERGTLGLAFARGAWTMRLFRCLGSGAEQEEGVALGWERGPLVLILLAGPSHWQGGELSLRRGRWGLFFRSRLHPRLGLSHGAGILVY